MRSSVSEGCCASVNAWGRVILAIHIVDLQLGFVDCCLECHVLTRTTATILAVCRTDE
jgi:hypothetical protein